MALFFPISTGRAGWDYIENFDYQVVTETVASGARRSVCSQILPRKQFTYNFRGLTKEEKDLLFGFYCRCKGSYECFYMKDFEHSQVIGQTLIKENDVYQCLIPNGDFQEKAYFVENVIVYINNERYNNFTLIDNCKISLRGLDVLPQNITADYEYYNLVHFTSNIQITQVARDWYNCSFTVEMER